MDTVLKEPEISARKIQKKIKKQISSEIEETEIAQVFLIEKIPVTVKKYFGMVKDGRNLVEPEYMSVRAAVEQITKREQMKYQQLCRKQK